MNNNPFMNTPYNNGMKTPQQYQQELDQMQQRYIQQYNQFNNNINNINNSNYYNWKYQEYDNEIESLQVRTDGTPFILVGNGILYIKKFVNGQTYISMFSFQPLNNVGEPKQQDEPKQADLSVILDRLDNLYQRLEKIENKGSDSGLNERNVFKEVRENDNKRNASNKSN